MIAVVIPTLEPTYRVPVYEGCSVFVVYDGSPPLPKHPAFLVGHQKGFAHACNVGLAHAQHLGYKNVLILNDDAHISPEDISKMIHQLRGGDRVIGPVITDDRGIQSAGIKVSSWGRVALNKDPTHTTLQALSGACLLIPSWLRFDEGYPHGFEDIELCARITKMGLDIELVREASCFHMGGHSIPHGSKLWFQHSIYGQLRFFGKRRYFPIIILMGLLQARHHRDSLIGVWQGGLRWWHQRSSKAT